MSHLTRIATRLLDEELLRAACAAMDLPVHGAGEVMAFDGGRAHVDLVVPRGEGRPYSLGFRREGESRAFAIVGEFLDMPWRQADFVARITQEYAIAASVRHAERMGYQHVTRERQDDGSVVIRATQSGVGFVARASVSGESEIEGVGFRDGRCLRATEELERTMGGGGSRALKRTPNELTAQVRARLSLEG